MRFVLIAVAGVSLASSGALAHSQYIADFPNGSAIDGNGCINCHNNAGGGGSRNSFGNAMASAGLNWASVCHNDSDGDGQTNGQELGDPDCVWTRGSSPARTSAISNPGKSSSTSSNPTGGSNAGGEGEGEGAVGEGEGEGGGDAGGTWMCDPTWRGDGSCDCGCGAQDADCADNSVGSCQYNDCDSWQPTQGLQPESNNPTLCQGGIAPTTTTTCPANATLSADGQSCQCNSGFVPDPSGQSCVSQTGTCPAHASGAACTCDSGYHTDPTSGGCVVDTVDPGNTGNPGNTHRVPVGTGDGRIPVAPIPVGCSNAGLTAPVLPLAALAVFFLRRSYRAGRGLVPRARVKGGR